MAKAAVVIPNFNGADHLVDCLEALQRQTFTDAEVVVVDNASTDGSIALVRERYPSVRVIELGDNRGFSAAVNAGIAATEAPYVVLLNNDTRAADEWLDRLITAMDETPEAGSGTSKLVRFGEPETIDAAGDTFVPRSLSGLSIGIGDAASRYERRSWVFGACAAAGVYRRSMLDDIGAFDEDFFLTHEDVDLAMRAQNAGYRCVFVPDAVVEHKRSPTYRITSPNIEAIGLRNRIWVVGKNAPLPLALFWTAAALPHIVAMVVRKLIWARRPSSKQTGAAWSNDVLSQRLVPMVLAGIRALPAKRRSVAHTRRRGSGPLLHAIAHPHEPVAP